MVPYDNNDLPLSGIRVLDLGQIVAGPFAATLLGEFGAEVIKIEPPGVGDNLRELGPKTEGKSVWWLVEGRNKKSITLNLQSEKGRTIFKDLVMISDIIVENYLPGTMERWGLGYEDLHRLNSRIIMVRVSGFGQTGPYSKRYGYDRVGLAMGGLLYVSGYPDRIPVKPGVSWGDYTAGLFGALGAMFALYYRDVVGSGEGQVIDIALYECAARLLEWTLAHYDLEGVIRERMGNLHPASAPGNTYETCDGKWLVIGCTTDRVFARLCRAMEQEVLLTDARFANAEGRSANQKILDAIVAQWVQELPLKEALDKLIANGVPCAPIYNVKDMFDDPHYRARNSIVEVKDELGKSVRMQGVVPNLSQTPGRIEWAGTRLGHHNREILGGLLGMTEEAISELEKEGII